MTITLASKRYTIAALGSTLDSRYPGGGAGGFTPEAGFTVSGTFADGGLVTIARSSGSFGAKSQAAPLLFDTVQNQSEYSALNDGDAVLVGGTNPWLASSGSAGTVKIAKTGHRHTRSTAHYKSLGGGQVVLENPYAPGSSSPPDTIRTLYVSWWQKFSVSPYELTNNASHKFIRVWNGGNDDLRVSWTQHQLFVTNTNAGGSSAITADYTTDHWSAGSWHKHELWVDGDTGVVQAWVNGTSVGSISNAATTHLCDPTYPSGLRVSLIGFDPANGTAEKFDLTYDMDDVWIDTTRQRFVIANSATWAFATVREDQPATAWATGEVTVTANFGVLDPTSECFLHFVSEAGATECIGAFNASGGFTAQSGFAVVGSFVEDGSVTITKAAGGLGATGPTLVYYNDFRDVADGAYGSGKVGGRGTVASGSDNYPLVKDVSGMPYGKAIRIGANGTGQNDTNYGQVSVVDTEATQEWFEFQYIYYPAANQDNAIPYLDTAATWQCKNIWHYYQSDGYSSTAKQDLFGGLGFWYTTGAYWWDFYKFTGNDGTPVNTATGTTASASRWRESPMVRHLWVKNGVSDTDLTGSNGLYRITDTSTGLIESASYAGTFDAIQSTIVTPGFDRFTVPGYARGFLLSANAELYFGQIYETAGPGAAARVEIADSATYDSAKKYTICLVDSWSDTQVVATVRLGVFSGLGASGKHLFITDLSNVTSCVGEIL